MEVVSVRDEVFSRVSMSLATIVVRRKSAIVVGVGCCRPNISWWAINNLPGGREDIVVRLDTVRHKSGETRQTSRDLDWENCRGFCGAAVYSYRHPGLAVVHKYFTHTISYIFER